MHEQFEIAGTLYGRVIDSNAEFIHGHYFLASPAEGKASGAAVHRGSERETLVARYPAPAAKSHIHEFPVAREPVPGQDIAHQWCSLAYRIIPGYFFGADTKGIPVTPFSADNGPVRRFQ
jgi:hypothetical protein